MKSCQSSEQDSRQTQVAIPRGISSSQFCRDIHCVMVTEGGIVSGHKGCQFRMFSATFYTQRMKTSGTPCEFSIYEPLGTVCESVADSMGYQVSK